MRIGDIIHKIAEIVDMVNDPDNNANSNDKEPEDLFVPPLQQKLEILKKSAGLDNVFDQEAADDEPLE